MPERLISVALDGRDLPVHFAQTLGDLGDDFDEGSGSASSFGRWGLNQDFIYVSTGLSRVGVYRVTGGNSPERTAVHRFYLATSPISVEVWRRGTQDGLTIQSASMLDGASAALVEDFFWDGACMHRRSRIGSSSGTSTISHMNAVQVDDDPEEEFVFSDSLNVFVLDPSPEGMLTLLAWTTLDEENIIDPVGVDLDGDGIDEIIPIHFLNRPGGPAYIPLPSPVFRLVR